jgi:hypothetical protein
MQKLMTKVIRDLNGRRFINEKPNVEFASAMGSERRACQTDVARKSSSAQKIGLVRILRREKVRVAALVCATLAFLRRLKYLSVPEQISRVGG